MNDADPFYSNQRILFIHVLVALVSPISSCKCRLFNHLIARNGTKDMLKLITITLGDVIGSQYAVSKPRISLEGQHSTKHVLTSDSVSLLPGMTLYFTLTFSPR